MNRLTKKPKSVRMPHLHQAVSGAPGTGRRAERVRHVLSRSPLQSAAPATIGIPERVSAGSRWCRGGNWTGAGGAQGGVDDAKNLEEARKMLVRRHESPASSLPLAPCVRMRRREKPKVGIRTKIYEAWTLRWFGLERPFVSHSV
jgi:hypothetical protein